MEVILNKDNPVEGSIQVKLTREEYQPLFDKKVKEYARKATIKGFRPGKVPPGMIKKLYGKSILVEEVNELLSKALTDYIKDNDIKLLGEPLPDETLMKKVDWDNPEEFEFGYKIGMQGDFVYDISKKQKVKKYLIEVDKKTVKETIEDILLRNGKEEEKEVSEKGDFFRVSVKSPDGTVTAEDQTLRFEEINKKEEKKFVGLKKGSTLSVDINKTISDDYKRNHLAGIAHGSEEKAEGTFEIAVNSIHQMVPAEMGQEVYDTVFGKDEVKDEKGFKEKIEETIKGNYDRESENFLSITIRKHLIDNTKIDLPDTFLKEWFQKSGEEGGKVELNDEEYQQYADAIRWDMVRSKIASDKEIKVETEEILQEARYRVMQQFGGPQIMEALKDKFEEFVMNYLKYENGKNYTDIHSQLLNAKVFEEIKSEINITEKSVKLDEFTKLVNK